jgi:hypothetical protein
MALAMAAMSACSVGSARPPSSAAALDDAQCAWRLAMRLPGDSTEHARVRAPPRLAVTNAALAAPAPLPRLDAALPSTAGHR